MLLCLKHVLGAAPDVPRVTREWRISADLVAELADELGGLALYPQLNVGQIETMICEGRATLFGVRVSVDANAMPRSIALVRR